GGRFFFSSRRRHTRCLSGWSSDVCSSDLREAAPAPPRALGPLASYAVEYRGLAAQVPEAVRERLLGHYQGVVNDNVYKLVTLKQDRKSVVQGKKRDSRYGGQYTGEGRRRL